MFVMADAIKGGQQVCGGGKRQPRGGRAWREGGVRRGVHSHRRERPGECRGGDLNDAQKFMERVKTIKANLKQLPGRDLS